MGCRTILTFLSRISSGAVIFRECILGCRTENCADLYKVFFFQSRIFRFQVGCPRMTLLYINYQCVRLATSVFFFYFDVDIFRVHDFLRFRSSALVQF